MYEIKIRKQAKKKLLKATCKERSKLTEKIVRLGNDPDDSTLDVKKLTGQFGYRLRVGDWRIIFSRDDCIKVIAIEKLKARGDVYK